MKTQIGIIWLFVALLTYTIVNTKPNDSTNPRASNCSIDCVNGFKSNTTPGTLQYLAFKELASRSPKSKMLISYGRDGILDGFKSFGINSVSVHTDGAGLIPVVLTSSAPVNSKSKYTVMLFDIAKDNQLNYQGQLTVDLAKLNVDELVVPILWEKMSSGLDGKFSISLIQSENTDAILVTPVRNIGKTLDVKFSPERGYVSNITFLKQKSIQKDSPIQAVFTFK